MFNAKGYAQVIDPGAAVMEYDTTSCCHCGGIIFVKPGTALRTYLIAIGPNQWKEEPGASCWRCGPEKAVCLSCYAKGECTPFERWLDEVEGTVAKGRIII